MKIPQILTLIQNHPSHYSIHRDRIKVKGDSYVDPKLFYSWNFTIPFLFGANVRINHILTNYNRQNSLFYR